MHVAEQDAVPLVLFVGQVPRAEIGRRSFQEVDYAKTFSDMAKAVYLIHDSARIPEIVARAFVEAEAPTPGPVVVVLPEDMLEDVTEAPVIEPLRVPQAGPAAAADIGEIAALIAGARRPLLIAGGGGLGTARGRKALLAAAEAHGLPVALTFKRQDYFPNAHPNYAGHLGFKIAKAAVAALSGGRPDPRRGHAPGRGDDPGLHAAGLAGAAPAAGPRPRRPAPDRAQLHRRQGARGGSGRRARGAGRLPAKVPPQRAAWLEKLHEPVAKAMPWTAPADGLLDMGPVVAALIPRLAKDAIFVTDAGNFSGWLHRHFPFSGEHVLIGCVGGAMGIGMPAAVAAALRFPGRQVIRFIGDGGALMTGSELATAVQYGAKVKAFISNNGTYGTIRMHQELAYKGRVHGTELKNPDFAKWAESFGALGLTIASIEEAPGVVERALAHDGPVVVDVKTALEHITPFATIAGLRG